MHADCRRIAGIHRKSAEPFLAKKGDEGGGCAKSPGLQAVSLAVPADWHRPAPTLGGVLCPSPASEPRTIWGREFLPLLMLNNELVYQIKARWGRLVRSTEHRAPARRCAMRVHAAAAAPPLSSQQSLSPLQSLSPVLGLCLLCRFCVRSPALQNAIFF